MDAGRSTGDEVGQGAHPPAGPAADDAPVPRARPTRTVLAVLGWAAAAAVASIVGLGAVRLIGDGITGAGSDPLTEAEVSALLAASRQSTGTSGAPATGPAASPTTAGPTGTAQPATPGPTATATVEGRGQILRTPGGVLTAECVQGDRAYLLYWSPAAGYATAPDVRRGPNRHAELRFVGPVDAVEVRVSCENGQPAVEWETDDDDGGDDG